MGYFLLSIWAINYTSTSLFGGITMISFLFFTPVPFEWALGLTALMMFCFSILFARHSKSYFVAADHFIDPHRVGGKEKTGEDLKKS